MSDKDKIKIYKNLISKEEAATAYELLKSSNFHGHDEHEIDSWKGKTLAGSYVPVYVSKILKRVIQQLYPEVKDFYGLDIKNVEDVWEGLVHKHFVGDDQEDGDSLGLHWDDSTRSDYAISAVVYWNDDFDGGILEFVNQELIYKPEAGDVVIFLPTQKYMHRVTKMESGVRYASPYWYIFN